MCLALQGAKKVREIADALEAGVDPLWAAEQLRVAVGE